MLLKPIITSLLETDMYKFSMGQCIYHQFSDYKTTWSFKCRNTDVHFTHEMVEEIKEQIKAYCGLRFTEEELEYLHKIKWMKGSYVDFLRLWQPRYEDYEITEDCNALNYSIYNLSFMPVTGGLNNFKGTNRLMNEENEQKLDRGDKFIYHINDFYENKSMEHIIQFIQKCKQHIF